MISKLNGAGIAAAVIVVSSIAAHAADLPRQDYKAPAYVAPAGMDWSGWYVGANAGYAFGKSNFSTSVSSNPGGFFSPAEIAAHASNGSGSLSPNGFTGGIQLGYNWQWNRVVFGIEGDIDALMLKADRSVTYPDPTIGGDIDNIQQSIKTEWLATIRPRLGYAFGNFLPYITGGVAGTQIKATTTYSESLGATGTSSVSKLKIGWTAGLGLEYALWSRWSVKAEYLYASFGSVAFDTPLNVPGAAMTNSVDLKAHIVRLGVNYRF
jgi:outer membrane immunogenic protein